MPTRHVALLRGINLGGHNRLPMKDFKAVLEGLGCGDVATYIQSGNAVFTPPGGKKGDLAARIASGLRDGTDLDVPVVTRTGAELAKVLTANPFLAEGLDGATLAVGFLAAKPTAARVRAMDPDRSPPDRFVVSGREIYFHFPQGIARSKLTSTYLDKALGTTVTVRNWKTTKRLAEMAGG